MNDGQGAAVAADLPMSVVQASGCGTDDGSGMLERQRSAQSFEQGPDVHPVEVLHDEEHPVGSLADIEHLDDVRMVELGRQSRLVEEHVHERGIVGKVGVNAFENDGFLEPV